MAAWSNTAEPVDWLTVTSVTAPVEVSRCSKYVPLPLRCALRAACEYSGRGPVSDPPAADETWVVLLVDETGGGVAAAFVVSAGAARPRRKTCELCPNR